MIRSHSAPAFLAGLKQHRHDMAKGAECAADVVADGPRSGKPLDLLEARSVSLPAAPSLSRPGSLSGVLAPSSIPASDNRDPRRVAAWLEVEHHRARDLCRLAFGTTSPIPEKKRFIINTVTRPEAEFLADYLDVPRENIIDLNTRRWFTLRARTSRTRLRAASALSSYLDDQSFDGGSVTFLGHMGYRRLRGMQDEMLQAFARITVPELFSLFESARPAHLNMFSCFSDDFSAELDGLFRAEGATTIQRAFFRSEISPYPSRATKSRPIRFFYAGPEVGPGASCLSQMKHAPLLKGGALGVVRATETARR